MGHIIAGVIIGIRERSSISLENCEGEVGGGWGVLVLEYRTCHKKLSSK